MAVNWLPVMSADVVYEVINVRNVPVSGGRFRYIR